MVLPQAVARLWAEAASIHPANRKIQPAVGKENRAPAEATGHRSTQERKRVE